MPRMLHPARIAEKGFWGATTSSRNDQWPSASSKAALDGAGEGHYASHTRLSLARPFSKSGPTSESMLLKMPMMRDIQV